MNAKTPLSDMQFREICIEAASRSSDWPSYVREANVALRKWLGDDSTLEAITASPEEKTSLEERVQAELNELYKTLAECEYEFSVTDGLNEALRDSRPKWE